MRKTRINIVLNSFPRESETFLNQWILGVYDLGYGVNLLINSKKKNKHEQFRGTNIEITYKYSLRVILQGILFFFRYQSLKTSYYVAFYGTKKPNIIHYSYTSLAVDNIEALLELQKTGVKIFASCRGHSENVRSYIDKERGLKLAELFKVVDKVHCVSQEMLERMVRDFNLESTKGFVNRPAIKVSNFPYSPKQLDKEKITIITNGRLVSLKGYVFGLLAIKKLVDDGYNIEYRIIGSGAEQDNVLFYINRLKLTNHVVLLGSLEPNRVAEELSQSSIYLACTLNEGLSNAVIEAMSVGLPVISTNVNGMPEIVFHKKTGFLVEAFDSQVIFESVKELIEFKDLELLLKEARNLVTNEFNLERQIEEFHQQYQSV